MILTRDNLLRFVREKKYVTPSNVSEPFETSTMIASAALGELTKDKLLAVTNFKLGSSPYYYDPKQKEALIEIAEKHFSKFDRDIFLKLKEHQILNDKSLTVQEKLAIERIKDFAYSLEITYKDMEFTFWVWYLRDLNETKSQILDALKAQDKTYVEKQKQDEEIKNSIENKKENLNSQKNSQANNFESNRNSSNNTNGNNNSINSNNPFNREISREIKKEIPILNSNSNKNEDEKKISNEHLSFTKNQEEIFIEKYLDQNYLNIENKQKQENGISYTCILKVHKLNILIDCFYFYKKPSDGEIIKFYTSSMRPKIAFVSNCPKKLYQLANSCDNFDIVNI